jgi:hypothetical protein
MFIYLCLKDTGQTNLIEIAQFMRLYQFRLKKNMMSCHFEKLILK